MLRRLLAVLPRDSWSSYANGDEASVDRHRVLAEVDVAPFESEEFAATHPGVGGEPERREQTMPDRSPQKGCQLSGGPCLGFVFGNRPEPRRVSNESDVSVHDPAFRGVIEGASDNEVNLEHRLGCQCLCAGFGGSELRLVKSFEVGDFQSADRDPAEGWEDVAFDLAALALPCRLRQGVGLSR